jgi:hypothetical protein
MVKLKLDFSFVFVCKTLAYDWKMSKPAGCWDLLWTFAKNHLDLGSITVRIMHSCIVKLKVTVAFFEGILLTVG